MRIKFAVLAGLMAAPALADPGYFSLVRKGQVVRVILPSGYCDAKVQQRDPYRLTLKLRKTTAVCGRSGATSTLSRKDVRDVVKNQPLHKRTNHVVVMLAVYAILQGVYAVAAVTESTALTLVTLFGGVAGLVLLWPQPPSY